ncbi:hypothetical protein PRIC2_001719 [Phytophthora ramorum]
MKRELEPLALDGRDLDKELLSALDEMLSFTGVSPIETGCDLADAFAPTPDDGGDQLAMDALLLETSPLIAIEKQKEEGEASPLDHQRGGKDARTAPYAKTKPRRRKRPKDELDYLRTQVKGLQEELVKLSPDSDGAEGHDELFTQWKMVADRQKAESDRSVVENLKLRSMLEGQLQVARSLEAAIQHHQEEAAQLLSMHRVQAELKALEGPRRPRATSLSDDVLFAQLNVGLEAQYAEFDTVMGRTGLAQALQNSKGIETVHDGYGIAFRHEEARLLPFSMPAVHRAMWSCVRYGKAKEFTGVIHTRVVNNDHLNVTIVDKLKLPKSRNVSTCAKLAMRRYFEQNRIVVVWSGYVEITGSLSVRLRERGYTSSSIFDFSKNAETTTSSVSGVPGCAFRLALQIKPEMDEFDAEQEASEHVGEVTDLVVGSYHRNFGLMYQVIENLLFHDSSGGEVDEHERARFAAY